MKHTAGSIIDNRYELLRLLGAGATSEVFLAREIDLERLVAVKIYSLAVLEQEQEKRWKRILREAQALAKISNPGIVSIFRVGALEDGSPFIVMEYVEGTTLRWLIIDKAPLPCHEVVQITMMIAEALACAHRESVVHRDVKPENITVTKAGNDVRIKLLDFGFCKDLGEGGAAASTHSAIGTPAYMSPEQCLNEPVGYSSDFYSLGCVCYELASGRTPFQAESMPQMMLQHLSKTPDRLLDTSPKCGLPPALDDFLARCLAKTPGQRWQDADELINALRAIEAEDCQSTFYGSREVGADKPTIKVKLDWRICAAAVLAAGIILTGWHVRKYSTGCLIDEALSRRDLPALCNLLEDALASDKLKEASAQVSQVVESKTFLGWTPEGKIKLLYDYFRILCRLDCSNGALLTANRLFRELIQQGGDLDETGRSPGDEWGKRLEQVSVYLIKNEHSPVAWYQILFTLHTARSEHNRGLIKFLQDGQPKLTFLELRAESWLRHASKITPESFDRAAGLFLEAADRAWQWKMYREYDGYMTRAKACHVDTLYWAPLFHVLKSRAYVNAGQLDRADTELALARKFAARPEFLFPEGKYQTIEKELTARRNAAQAAKRPPD
jgi:serine/threonine protein kinase